MGYKFPQSPLQPMESMIQNASPEAIHLMQSMLQYDPKKRPTAAECLQFPFFQVKVPLPMNAPGAEGFR